MKLTNFKIKLTIILGVILFITSIIGACLSYIMGWMGILFTCCIILTILNLLLLVLNAFIIGSDYTLTFKTKFDPNSDTETLYLDKPTIFDIYTEKPISIDFSFINLLK